MDSHLNHQQMLAFLDGELSKAETNKAADHLHACWTCRIEMERLEDDIAVILDAHNENFIPAIPPPPIPWPSLGALLAKRRPQLPQSMFMRFADGVRGLMTPVRIAFLTGLVACCALYGYLRVSTSTVSAQEVLSHIQTVDAQRLAIPPGSVIRERIQVKRIPKSKEQVQTNSMSAWKSPLATLWRASDGTSEVAVTALRDEYRSHGVAIDLPLSASAIGTWGTAAGGPPSVTQRGSRLDLRFASSTPESRGDGLSEVALRVESSTWRVEKLTLNFSDATFEISEDEFSFVPKSEVPPTLLAELEPVPSLFPAKTQPVSDSELPTVRLPRANFDAVQLNVLTILHRLHADLGEPVLVTHSNQSVVVGIWQLPQDRQGEIRTALQNELGVVIQTAPPAHPALSSSPATAYTTPNASARMTLPSDTEEQTLIKYFNGAEKEQAFTRTALSRSSSILAHLYALRNLQAQFPPQREETLSPTDRENLNALVRDHAMATVDTLTELRDQLTPLDAAFQIAATPPIDEHEPYQSRWQDTSLDALGTARSADRLIRDAFTTSDSPTAPSVALLQLQEKLARLIAEMRDVEGK